MMAKHSNENTKHHCDNAIIMKGGTSCEIDLCIHPFSSKSIDKKTILIAVLLVLLIFNTGIYAGLFASVEVCTTIGMQILWVSQVMKRRVEKYQLTMPISSFTVVASKYVSVLYTVAISILAVLRSNLGLSR